MNIKRPVGLITDFAKASNKISSWVATEIVTAPDEKSRVATIEAFIKVAQCCWELNSFNTAMDIISGLNSFSISRLKQIWDVRIATHATHETRGTHARSLTVHSAVCLCTRARGVGRAGVGNGPSRQLPELSQPRRDFGPAHDSLHRYRTFTLSHRSLFPSHWLVCVPTALVLRDLTFANDGNPSFLEGYGHQISKFLNIDSTLTPLFVVLFSDLINFERMTLFFSIISDILKYQLLPQHQIQVNDTALSFLNGVEVLHDCLECAGCVARDLDCYDAYRHARCLMRIVCTSDRSRFSHRPGRTRAKPPTRGRKTTSNKRSSFASCTELSRVRTSKRSRYPYPGHLT